MIDYLSERCNPLRNIDTAELNLYFNTLVAAFTKEWLVGGGENPVQVLWARKDDLATIELVLLGHAIHRLQRIDPRWVERRVATIKGKDANERRGDLFELLALSLFDGDGVRVKPMPEGNPGYDGTVVLPGNAAIQVSIKSLIFSTHQHEFKEQAAKIEAELIASLAQRGITAVTCCAIATACPGPHEWSLLKNNLGAILDAVRSGSYGKFVPIAQAWKVIVVPLPEEDGPFSSKQTSYTFIAIAPYHRNERQNLLALLDKACANFTRHADNLVPEPLRLIFVNVRETVSLASCKEWASQYFADSPGTPVGAILLYQPTVARNPSDTTETSVYHYMTAITGPQFNQWYQSQSSHHPTIPLKVSVGIPAIEPPKVIPDFSVS